MNSACRISFVAAAFFFLHCSAQGASEIIIAIRYLQAEGVSHSHLYLYRDDGKFLRQLTNDTSGQDVDPSFAPDGESVVFTRERAKSPLEFWSVNPLGGGTQKFEVAPDWYEKAKTSPYFTNREEPKSDASPSGSPADGTASPSPAGLIGGRQTYK